MTRSKLTPRQLARAHPVSGAMLVVLGRCANKNVPRGTALLYEHQAGKMRQVKALMRRGFIKYDGCRAVTTKAGDQHLEGYPL